MQCLRAFACTLLVAYHIVGSGDDSGLKVAADSLWRHFELAVTPLRMPLFTFLSGYIYAARPPMDLRQWRGFLHRKALRLLLPYLTLTPLFMLGQVMTGRKADLHWLSIVQLYLIPDTFYWFLSALFLIFVVIATLDLCNRGMKAPAWIAIFVIWWSTNLLQPIEPNVIGVGNALYLGPCFVMGLMARRFGGFWGRPDVMIAIPLLAAACYGTYVSHTVFMSHADLAGNALLLIPLGCLLSLFLIQRFPTHPLMARLGTYSYTIFLFHIFFITAARLVLSRLGIQDTAALFAGALLLGLAGPMAVEQLLKRWHWSRLLLLGQVQRRVRAAATSAA